MATSTQLGKVAVPVQDGIITATSYDRVGVDRIAMMLIRGSAAASRAQIPDDTVLVNDGLKEHVVLEPQGD